MEDYPNPLVAGVCLDHELFGEIRKCQNWSCDQVLLQGLECCFYDRRPYEWSPFFQQIEQGSRDHAEVAHKSTIVACESQKTLDTFDICGGLPIRDGSYLTGLCSYPLWIDDMPQIGEMLLAEHTLRCLDFPLILAQQCQHLWETLLVLLQGFTQD